MKKKIEAKKKTKAKARRVSPSASCSADLAAQKRLKWLIYDVEWLLEQSNLIKVKRNRETIKDVLAYLKEQGPPNSSSAQ